jgi:hypothetical protein
MPRETDSAGDAQALRAQPHQPHTLRARRLARVGVLEAGRLKFRRAPLQEA